MMKRADLISKHADQLRRDGYLILENVADAAQIGAIRDELSPHLGAVPYCEGAFFGPETKRVGRVLSRSPSSHALVMHELVYGIVQAVLQPNCDSLQLSLTQGIEIFPGAVAQGPHRDQDMWWVPKGEMDYMVNVMWALDDFTETNGSTRLWPMSNHMDPNDPLLPEEDAISAVMPSGSACLFLGSTVHSGGENTARVSRKGLIVSYCLGWLKPWENQWLAYPPHIARHFDPELAALVGYSQHRPSLCNYEGQCPSVLLGDDKDWKPFVDALLPEQVALVDEYREMRLEMLANA
jgi:ectoine hydroxylase-related dioxygenase (phytanoyl-CoA dioxygenase family)